MPRKLCKLARAVSDANWGELVRQLDYKADWYGRELIKIDRYFPSSKRCSNCGYTVEKLPLNIREWDCPVGKPVILKRGLSATIQEFLMAAEYILSHGNPDVVLCERGIRSFDNYTRNVLDLGAVAALKQLTHLPIIVDPSHAAGKRELVAPLAKAAIACGADGLMIECHPVPEESVSDARQALSLEDMVELVESLRPVAAAVGRNVCQVEEFSMV
ncbi:MAG: transposase [Okeania sp. SIO3B5]|nr:zinc ribbon domain-containing protein [Okeania sp. SIO3B5]NEO55435.1 transposase [Okeania sp. SIO3B5]